MSTDPNHESDEDLGDESAPVADSPILENPSSNSPARATSGAIDEFDENDFDDDFDDDFEEEMDDDYEFEHALIEGEVVETDDEDEEIDDLEEGEEE